jgi:hypothetical protein
VYKANKKPKGSIDFKFPQSILKRTETFIENQNPFVKIIAQHYKVDTTKTKKDYDFKTDKGTGLMKVWGEVKMTDEYKSMTTRQRKEYSRDEMYDYLIKNTQFITHTNPQGVTSIYNLTHINPYAEEDPEAEYKKP